MQFFSVETSIQATDTFSNDEIRRSILFSSVYLVILGIFQLWVYYDARFYRYSLFRGRARKSITKNADEKTRPWDELEKEAQWVVDEVMAKFPPDVLAEAEKVPLVFEERSQRKTMDGRKIMGIYVGFIEGHVSEGKGPIILYLRSIEEYCAWSGKTFQDEVRTTYLHELGHHFGWNEKDVEKRDL